MGQTIQLQMADWLYNAGLVGFVNILDHADLDYKTKGSTIEFDSDILQGFEIQYFSYIISKYEKVISWYKIIAYENTLIKHKNSEYEEFTKKDLEMLNEYIKRTKNYLKSNSYIAAYKLIDNELDMKEEIKTLNTIKLKKNEDISERLEDVKKVCLVIERIVDYCKEKDSKKYLAAKNIIYTVIKNAWDGVCILNPQTKEKDMYIDYKKYFIMPLIEELGVNKEKYKYNCFLCNDKIKNLKNDLSFLNNTGFDVSRKSSHVWEFNNDVAVCHMCRLIYSCIPAGMTYVYDKGIYINANTSIKKAKKINFNVSINILNDNDLNQPLTYKALITSINEQYQDNMKYELGDIQVVRYENERYRFNMLTKKAIKIIINSREDLNSIIKCSFKENKEYINIYEIVIQRILNSQNLFTLISKLLVYKLSKPKDCRYYGSQLVKIQKINLKVMEVFGFMEKVEKDIIQQSKGAGYYLKEKYRDKGSKDKLNGIAYRLLNTLKTNNKDAFMDIVLNCHLYAQKSVPPIFMEALKNEEQFKVIGYAFVTGIIEGKENDIKENGGQ